MVVDTRRTTSDSLPVASSSKIVGWVCMSDDHRAVSSESGSMAMSEGLRCNSVPGWRVASKIEVWK